MLVTNISNCLPVKVHAMTKQQPQVTFTSNLTQDAFTSSKPKEANSNVSFGGIIPQSVLKLFGKDDESKRIASLDGLVDLIVKGEDFDLKQDYIDELLSESDYNYARNRILDKSVEYISKTDSKELQSEKIALLLHYDLIPELIRKQLHFKGVMKVHDDMPFNCDAPSLGPSRIVIKRNELFTNAVKIMLDDSNPHKAEVKKQYIKAVKDHLLSKTEHWASLRSEAVTILRDNAESIADIEPFFEAINLNKIKGTEIIGRELPTFHSITYPLDIEVKVKALKAIPVVLENINATPEQVEAVKQRIEEVKSSTDNDELKLACYEMLEQMI